MSRMQQITRCHRGWTVRRASDTSFALILALCVSGGRTAEAAPDGYHAYALTSVSAAQVIPELKELLATLPEPASVVADSQGSRILVQGTPQAHGLTAKFVQLIDRAAEARQVSQPQLQAYRVGPDLPQVADQIARQFTGRSDVRISSDLRTGQMLVLAPPEVQAKIARQWGQSQPKLAGSGAPAAATGVAAATPIAAPGVAPSATLPQPSGRQPAAPAVFSASAGPQVAQPLVLRHISWQTLHKGLERLLEHALPTTTLRSDQGETVQFRVQAAPNAEIAIEAGPAAGQITLRGRPDLVRSWAQVILALDAPTNASGDKTELVAVRAAQPRTLHRALTAIQTSAAARSTAVTAWSRCCSSPKHN